MSRPSFEPSRLLRPEQFVSRPGRALAAAALLLGLFLLLALLVPDRPVALDRRWEEWMRDLETPALTHIALVFNTIGKGLWRALTLAAIALILAPSRRLPALVAFAATEVFTPLLESVVKSLVTRPRPLGSLVAANGSSFPSGHAAYAGATAIALLLLFTKPDRRRRYAWALAVFLIAWMAWSRTYLQVHWLSDVLAGSLLGISVALGSFAGLQRLLGDGRREFRQRVE